MTFITDADEPIGEGPSLSAGVQLSRNHTLVNSITLSNPNLGITVCTGNACQSGWYNTAMNSGNGLVGEGNPTEQFNYDVTSMTAAWLVWPGRPIVSLQLGPPYYEYGNNPSFPDPNCATESGCNPPITMYFPSTECSVGFIENCTGTPPSIPLTTSDYHNYALSSGNYQTSDGAAMGAIIPSIDAAQTTTRYVCTSSCGTIGPYPD